MFKRLQQDSRTVTTAPGEFRKSSFSNHGIWGSNCVEVNVGNTTFVRDSKNRDGGTLSFSVSEWDAFVKGVKLGEFDLK